MWDFDENIDYKYVEEIAGFVADYIVKQIKKLVDGIAQP